MCLQLHLFIAATFCIQSVYPQFKVTISSITDVQKYVCGGSLVLRCQSNDTVCCNTIGKTRIWRKETITIMNHGAETPPSGKYTETFDNTQDYFELTFHNLKEEDFGKEYTCSYSFYSDSIKISEKLCDRYSCIICGWLCFLWGLLGIAILAFLSCIASCYFSDLKKQKVMKVVAIVVAGYVLLDLVLALPIGTWLCFCNDVQSHNKELTFIVLGVAVIFGYLVLLLLRCKDEKIERYPAWIFWGVVSITITTLVTIFLKKRWKKKNKKETNLGTSVTLNCPYFATGGKVITWSKISPENQIVTYAEGANINPNLPEDLKNRLKVTDNLSGGEYHLSISDVRKSDEGTYECLKSGISDPGHRIQLIVKAGGKSQSVESGSSCWPICRVGQDPNTSSSGPKKVRRSPEKERADKKKERKPTEVVRPQPSRPLPSRAQHLKTDNTGREEYSAENELFKPRPLPSISGHSDSPRPLPKRTPDDQLEKGGIQLEPLVDSTSEKKKKKKRKKKETKQSDEDD